MILCLYVCRGEGGADKAIKDKSVLRLNTGFLLSYHGASYNTVMLSRDTV